MDMDNRVGSDCRSGMRAGQGRAMGESWDNCMPMSPYAQWKQILAGGKLSVAKIPMG